jgi:hypothetical protein
MIGDLTAPITKSLFTNHRSPITNEVKPLIAIYISFFSVSALAQVNGVLSKRVTFDYENLRIKEALADLTSRYQVNFSYSSNYVPVRQRVTAKVSNVPLSTALDKLFEQTKVIYELVGEHVVLRVEPNKSWGTKESGKQGHKKKQPSEPGDEIPAILVKTEQPPEDPPSPDTVSVSPVEVPEMRTVRSEGKMYPFDETLLNFEKWRREVDFATASVSDKRIAQVSVLPTLGTNAQRSNEVTNNVSMNLIWGVNGGVDGLEIGGMVNMVKKDVKGFQAAGIGNTVGRNMTGTQVGGVFNFAGGTTRGFQAAGLANFANNAEAAQAAGVVNWVKGDMAGVQASGLFNMTGGDASALQAAGAFNFNKGNAKVQIGGVFNVAKDVEIAQVGGVFNVAKEVKGFQIALINVSDTVSGVPIGLINIVKKGYNKFEMYGSEILHGNFQMKLGANAFYNIFHVGARVPQGNGKYTWGLGYGIGTVSTVSPKTSLNFELMAIHINENEPWTNKLNSIGQFRFLWHHQLGKSIGFFLGPTANVMISQLKNSETGEPGSPIVPYDLIDEKLSTRTGLKGWVGVNAGFRF